MAAAKAAAAPPGGAPPLHGLSRGELQSMLGQCLKLASENKITPQNTWGLPLIEHLPDLIREDRAGDGTNFQRASVTLDAGVKIYSYRVDSVHTETYKMLGGLGRASGSAGDAGGEEGEGEEGDPGEGGTAGAGSRRRRAGQELDPEATLESEEAITLKKLDLAFAVDPLFHKTSAQFDEGGAKGLLLNNLSVYRGCEIVFDSMDIPEAALDSATQQHSAQVDLSALQSQLQALSLLTGSERLSPALDAILEQLGQAPPPGAAAAAEAFVQQVAEASGDVAPTQSLGSLHRPATAAAAGDGAEAMAEDGGEGAAAGATAGTLEEEEEAMKGVAAEYAYAGGPGLQDADLGADYDDDGFGGGFDDDDDDDAGLGGSGGGVQHEIVVGADGQPFSASKPKQQADAAGLGEDALQWLIAASSANSFVTGSRGWAGASHWRYRALPQAQQAGDEEQQGGAPQKKRAVRRKNDPLDFVELLQQEEPEFEMLAPDAGKRRTKQRVRTLLPEDHHYKVEALARYALRPRAAVATSVPGQAGVSSAASGDGGELAYDAFGADFGAGADSDDDDLGGGFGDGWGLGDLGDALGGEGEGAGGEQVELVAAARRVDKVEVNYSRAAKQVDVRALKEVMWRGLHAVRPKGAAQTEVVEMQDVLATVPADNPAGCVEDLSVHLCFICILHLANEHGLAIRSVPELDRLLITNVPA